MGVSTLVGQKEIIAPLLSLTDTGNKILVNDAFSSLPHYLIDQICWRLPQFVPSVSFKIGYTPDALLIKFNVSETSHKAQYAHSNEPVFKDSCVEFFMATDESGYYYNFEFNSLGTCLASYGSNRNDRVKLDKDVIATIDRWVTWNEYSPEKPLFNWELTVKFPPAAFCYHAMHHFTAGTYRVNLYKCGDELPEPHFIAWNPILSPVQDFHQLGYFGLLKLQ
jgi:hypothetical protein